MLTQLQFDDDLKDKQFNSPQEIVDFLCEKLAQGVEGQRIMVPQQIRQDLGADLSVGLGKMPYLASNEKFFQHYLKDENSTICGTIRN